MMNRLLIFGLVLTVNFGGLAIGGLFTGPGVTSSWYAALPKAPWTPPGYVFGLAWTLVMLAFSWFGASVIQSSLNGNARRSWLRRLGIAWVLNVAWNPLFFTLHWTTAALIEILLLFGSVLWMAKIGKEQMGSRSAVWGLFPYALWLVVAISLNAYSALH